MNTDPMSLADDIDQSMERALIFGAFIDKLRAPTPAQLWLEQAAAKLEGDAASRRSATPTNQNQGSRRVKTSREING